MRDDGPTRLHDTATVDVTDRSDAVLAREETEQRASTAGFDETARAELEIVATELVTNLVKHADGGDLRLARITAGDRSGVRIESLDAGPGITDVREALADGASTVGSLGSGLGAVNRLVDELHIQPREGSAVGTHVVADRWVRPRYRSTSPCPLAVGAASRPRSSGDPNGDAFVIKRWADNVLVGVIDGLGHGRPAHDAATVAKQYIETHFDRPLASIFRGVERACTGTRGVVLALARFNWDAEALTYASVGNIAYTVTAPDSPHLVTRRGVLGRDSPEPVVTENRWKPGYDMAIYSDGLRSRWTLDDYDRTGDESASALAHRLLTELGKADDDATVVVVTEGNP